MLKTFATLFVISFSACLTVCAQADPVPPTGAPQAETKISPEKQVLITELLRVMNTRQQTQEVINTMLDQFEKEIPDIVWAGLSESVSKLTKQEQDELLIKITQSAEETSQRLRDAISKKLDFNKLDEITAAVYGKYFSETEISDLISFYKSNTGQRVLQLTPEMLAESMERSQELMMPILKDLMHDVSTEQTQKFQKEVTAMVESHHRAKKPSTSKHRPK